VPIYFGPMEGITDSVYRRTHHACFGGVAKYFIPFVSPTQHKVFTPREMSAVSPKENEGMYAVPQILTKHADHFLWAAQALADMGYLEVNLNLGCPSGTVAAKGKGSGMLRDLDNLKRFLDDIFTHTPIPLSIKTRIGYQTTDEWPALLNLLKDYPACEFIVHPRTRTEFYKGWAHRDAFAAAAACVQVPLVYNGDLFTAADCAEAERAFPSACALMIGRGLIANPALAQEAAGGDALTLSSLRHFHNSLYRQYASMQPGNLALIRMRQVMTFMAYCFENPQKPLKAICKSRTNEDYWAAAQRLFDEHPLRKNPGYLCMEE